MEIRILGVKTKTMKIHERRAKFIPMNFSSTDIHYNIKNINLLSPDAILALQSILQEQLGYKFCIWYKFNKSQKQKCAEYFFHLGNFFPQNDSKTIFHIIFL